MINIGGNDVSNNTDHELIEELYDQLIALIKSSNPNIKIVLCKLAPRGDADVNIVNMIIERLTQHHKIISVDTFRNFHDHRGNIQMRFMGHDHIHPSASGIKRIAGSINQTVHIVSDFKLCVYQQGRQQHNNNNRPIKSAMHKRHSSSQQLRCMKCNEQSHQTSDCRHTKTLKCWSCGLLGHKQENCWNFH